MQTVTVICDYCGAEYIKKVNAIHNHNFCCRDHFYRWNAKRISEYNKSDNPMNKPGGVMEARLRRSAQLRGRGEGKSYKKFLGRHEHRYVAEMKLGRALRQGEVVHHIDGNFRNNNPDNLMILPSQAEHARIHFRKKKEGDANDSYQ